MPKISFVMCDMAGTTVDDRIDNMPLVTWTLTRTFAISAYALDLKPEDVDPLRGQKKQTMIARLVDQKWKDILEAARATAGSEEVKITPESVTAELFAAFEVHLAEAIASMRTEMQGTSKIFRWLHQRGVKIGVGSGFSQSIVEKLVDQLGWSEKGSLGFDLNFVGAAEQAGAGRPDPVMLQLAMSTNGVTDPRAVVKIGDTGVDVEEGRNAGCITVAVLSGTQTKEELAKTNPDFMLESIADLPTIWEKIEALP